MGRASGQRLLWSGKELISGGAYDTLLNEYPHLGVDVLLASPRQDERLW
jgi:hypothetical protein